MNVLIVYAHYDAKSFNASLKDQAITVLTRQGHAIRVSDLYAQNFEPRAGRADFLERTPAEPLNYIVEQKHAASGGDRFTADIRAEMDKIRWADLIIFQCPIWWFSVPAILKGWFDRVLAAGFSWDTANTYDQALLAQKKCMLSVTTGGDARTYEPAGINGDIGQILFPIQHGTLYYCGMTVLEPFIAYAAVQAGDEGRKKYLRAYAEVLRSIENRRALPFHPHADYDDTNRLKGEVVSSGT